MDIDSEDDDSEDDEPDDRPPVEVPADDLPPDVRPAVDAFPAETLDADYQRCAEFVCHTSHGKIIKPCQIFNGQPCIQQFSTEFRVAHRMSMRELTTGELDLALLGMIHVMLDCSEKTVKTKRTDNKERQRDRCTYKIQNKSVCRETFCFFQT